MSQLALDAPGTRLLIGDGATPETFNPITRIRSIEGPGGASAIIDATDFDSIAREKKVGVADEGQLTMALVYLPANPQHAQLRLDRATRTLRNFKLIFEEGTTWCFSAFVTGIELSGKVDDVIRADVELEITGGIFDCTGIYEIHLFVPGTLASGMKLLSLKLPRSVSFPAGLTDSRGGAEVSAAGKFTVSFRRTGVEFGTGVILAGGTEMSFLGGPETFAPGEELEIVALNTDATLTGLELTLVGAR
jgi:hypothetical protein